MNRCFPRFLAAATMAALPMARPVQAQDPAPAAAAALPALPATGPLAFRDGDLVVLLGDTFFERDGNYGHLEAALTATCAGKHVRFRNMGWSGDTPRCESRSYFGPPQEGFDRLKAQLTEIQPTVVICCYGAVDAFHGEAGHADFTASYERMLNMIRDVSNPSVILMSPPATGDHPALANHGPKLAGIRDAIQKLAASRNHRFADIFTATQPVPKKTVNGVTFTETDYAAMTPAIVAALGLPAPSPDDTARLAELRKAVVAKQRLFFHRWRPQNETYLFGFRKHEQGNNGVEIPMFDPLIAKQEEVIASIAAKSKGPN
jgi:lysophospholipase L1-like esterase